MTVLLLPLFDAFIAELAQRLVRNLTPAQVLPNVDHTLLEKCAVHVAAAGVALK